MIFNSDNFDGGTGGSTLAGRVSSGGQTWSANLDSGHTGEAILYPLSPATSTKLGTRNSAPNSSALYYLSGDPPSADYGVNFTYIYGNALTLDGIGVAVRIQETTPDPNPHFYWVHYDGFFPRWELRSRVGAGVFLLGTYDKAYSAGTSLNYTFRACGTTLDLIESGVTIISVVDTAITGIGHAGVVIPACSASFTNTDGWWIDNFEGDSNACNPFPPAANNMTTVSTWEA